MEEKIEYGITQDEDESKGQIIKNGQIEVYTNDMTAGAYYKTRQQIKQFYEAIEVSKEFNVDYEYNKQNEQIELLVPV